MDPWGLINIADAYLDVYIGEYCKQEGITLSASAAKNKTFFKNQEKKQMVQNLWFNKQKFYYGTGKKLECTSLIHNIKVQVAKIPRDYVF